LTNKTVLLPPFIFIYLFIAYLFMCRPVYVYHHDMYQSVYNEPKSLFPSGVQHGC